MKKSKLGLLLFTLIMSLGLILSACSSSKDASKPEGDKAADQQAAQGEKEQILRVNNSTEPGSLHPGKAQGTHDSWALNHIMEGLTKVDPEGKVQPGQAIEWKISDDGKQYVFTLRDGITWTNGDPVTAHDFEAAWKYALDPNTASEYAYQLYYLAGGQEYNSADPTKVSAEELQKLRDAVGVKAVDDKTLEVNLVNPTPYFLQLTAFYTYFPVNNKVQESNPDWPNEAATYVSNGAFKLVEWNHKQNMKLRKNENYYDKDKIKLTGIDFAMVEDENTAWQMFQSDQLDVAFPLPTDIVDKLVEEKKAIIGPELATYFYRFNTTEKPFNNVKVRQAFSMAIDREAIVKHVTKGGQLPAYGLVPFGILSDEGDFREVGSDYFKYDVEQAKKLLAEGLAEEGMTSLDNVSILYNTLEAHKKIAEAIQEMWRKNLGVEVTLENTEFQVKIDREHKLDYKISRAGWIGDYVDPMTFIDMFTSESGQNDTGWTNAKYDELVATAKSTMDNKVRMEAMHEAEEILMSEMPIAPIYFYTKPYALKDYVKGVYTPVDKYPQFHFTSLEK